MTVPDHPAQFASSLVVKKHHKVALWGLWLSELPEFKSALSFLYLYPVSTPSRSEHHNKKDIFIKEYAAILKQFTLYNPHVKKNDYAALLSLFRCRLHKLFEIILFG